MKKKRQLPTAEELMANALPKPRRLRWWDTHPLREQIATCLKNNASLAGLCRVLHREGFKDVNLNGLNSFKRFLLGKKRKR